MQPNNTHQPTFVFITHTKNKPYYSLPELRVYLNLMQKMPSVKRANNRVTTEQQTKDLNIHPWNYPVNT